jgi:hypothetical protein
LHGLWRTGGSAPGPGLPALADALVQLERDREQARRANPAERGSPFNREVPDIALWELGVSMVWKMLR